MNSNAWLVKELTKLRNKLTDCERTVQYMMINSRILDKQLNDSKPQLEPIKKKTSKKKQKYKRLSQL